MTLREQGWAFAQAQSDASKARERRRQPPPARVIEVIEVAFLRGDGIEGDPVRQVTGYYSLEGDFLAERDPAPEEAS